MVMFLRIYLTLHVPLWNSRLCARIVMSHQYLPWDLCHTDSRIGDPSNRWTICYTLGTPTGGKDPVAQKTEIPWNNPSW